MRARSFSSHDPTRKRWMRNGSWAQAVSIFGPLCLGTAAGLSVEASPERSIPIWVLVLMFVLVLPLFLPEPKIIRRRSIVVGADGLVVLSRRKEDVFLFADMRAIERAHESTKDLVTIRRTSGGVTLECSRDEEWIGAAQEALARFRERSAPDGAASAILRDKPASALRALASPEGSPLRAAAPPLEEIGSLIDDPAAAPRDRLAAAVVLRAHDPSRAADIARAAESTVIPALRTALVRVAEGADDDVIEAELEAVSDRAAAKTRSG